MEGSQEIGTIGSEFAGNPFQAFLGVFSNWCFQFRLWLADLQQAWTLLAESFNFIMYR